jgi:hypothetical protein
MTNKTQTQIAGLYDFSPSANEQVIVVGGVNPRTIYKAVQRGDKIVMTKHIPKNGGYITDIGDASTMAKAREIILARAKFRAARDHGEFHDFTDLAPYLHQAKA